MKKSLTYDEVKEFFQVCKDEQSLRALLTYYKEMKEREMYFLKKIKAVAERLKNIKATTRNKMLFNSLVGKDIRDLLNKQFKHGIKWEDKQWNKNFLKVVTGTTHSIQN